MEYITPKLDSFFAVGIEKFCSRLPVCNTVISSCRAFGQGKDIYQSLQKRIQSGPHFLLGGTYPTTLYVAVAKSESMQDQHLVQLVLERDLDRILCDGWISTTEFSARRENLRVGCPH
jgi:hypothetical protein